MTTPDDALAAEEESHDCWKCEGTGQHWSCLEHGCDAWYDCEIVQCDCEESGTWLSKGAESHRCPVPGSLERRRQGVKQNALWQCECGRVWGWRIGYGGHLDWYRDYETERAPKAPERHT